MLNKDKLYIKVFTQERFSMEYPHDIDKHVQNLIKKWHIPSKMHKLDL